MQVEKNAPRGALVARLIWWIPFFMSIELVTLKTVTVTVFMPGQS